MKAILLIALGSLVLTGGCGKKTMLRPAANHRLPAKAQSAAVQPGVIDLLKPQTQARPARDDELIVKSAPLAPDRFDLPPPG